jgi:hypothetical protein
LPPSESLISSPYRAQQEKLHEDAHGLYGTASLVYAPMVAEIIARMEVSHLLDYGCGSATNLPKALPRVLDKDGTPVIKHKLTYQAYDAGVPKYSRAPLPAQMVACIDVLEHIEPQFIDAVLDDLSRLTLEVFFGTIDTGPALKSLPDGRNAHILQRPIDWWFPKLYARFEFQTLQATTKHSFFFIGLAKPHLERIDGTPIT